MARRDDFIALKVGAFVLAGLAALMVFVLRANELNFLNKGYVIKCTFPEVHGLKVSSPVRVSGVLVGEVKEVNIVYDTINKHSSVEVQCAIRKGVEFPVDSRVEIISVGLLGDKGIEITPGTDYEHMVMPGYILRGQSEVSMQELIASGKDVAEEMKKSLTRINQMIGDDDFFASIKDSVSKVGDASDEAKEAIKDVRDILSAVKQGEGTLGRFIYDDTVYTLLEIMIFDLNRDVTSLIRDLKAHPWKLFFKTKEKKRK